MKIKCVLIDDEPLAIKVLQNYFANFTDFEVIGTFNNSLEALDFINSTSVDAVFLDINMPGKSGLECLKEIRNSEGVLKEVNIVMLSTSSDPENIQKALELGATCYAVKPSSFEKLKSLLKEVLSMDLVGIIKDRRKFLII